MELTSYKLLTVARGFLDETGVERIMIESEGITENVKTRTTDVITNITKALPMHRIIFEGTSATKLTYDCPWDPTDTPRVFAWCVITPSSDILPDLYTRGRYIREFGVDMDISVDTKLQLCRNTSWCARSRIP